MIWNQICERCHSATLAITMSKFNTDMICLECEDKERAHPDYPRAEAAELAACRAGNYNFPGIGKPRDL